VKANVEIGFGPKLLSGLEAGSKVHPTQPPHSLLEIGTPSGYRDISGTTMGDDDTPDIADIGDFSMVATRPTTATPSGGKIQYPSLVPDVGHSSSNDRAAGTFPPTVLGFCRN